jgi:hypothetical protein
VHRRAIERPAVTSAVKANQLLLQIVADVRKLDCNGEAQSRSSHSHA